MSPSQPCVRLLMPSCDPWPIWRAGVLDCRQKESYRAFLEGTRLPLPALPLVPVEGDIYRPEPEVEIEATALVRG